MLGEHAAQHVLLQVQEEAVIGALGAYGGDSLAAGVAGVGHAVTAVQRVDEEFPEFAFSGPAMREPPPAPRPEQQRYLSLALAPSTTDNALELPLFRRSVAPDATG
jgi:hypothetical protein